MRPARLPARFLRALLLRGATLWLLARLTAMGMLAAAGEAAGTLVPVWTIAASASLVLVDLWRRKELVLLHNLGVTTHGAVAVTIVPALVLEAGLLMFVQ